jgi:hypothetical protein
VGACLFLSRLQNDLLTLFKLPNRQCGWQQVVRR